MKNLFYSKKGNHLFWITGVDNYSNVEEMIDMLTKNADELAKLVPTERIAIQTFNVTKEGKYKNMRVFCTETTVVPEGTETLDAQWDMSKWLTS